MDTLYGYISAPDVAIALGKNSGNEQVLSTIKTALLYVEELVHQYINVSTLVAEDAATKLFDSSGTNIIPFGQFVRAVDSVHYVDIHGNTQEIEYTALQPTNPVRRDGSGNPLYTYMCLQPIESARFPAGIACISVVGDFGMETVPRQVQQAIIYAVQHFLNVRNIDETVASDTVFGQGSIMSDPAKIDYLPVIAKRLLDPWKYNVVLD